jgi:FKBP12-rapamycin complex-associated protein
VGFTLWLPLLLLTVSRRKNAPSEEPIFQCIGMLASAVGPNLTKLLHDQLDLMLACGLSEPLVQALAAIAKFISPLLKTIQGIPLALKMK